MVDWRLVAASLFAGQGGFYVLIGVLTPLLLGRVGPGWILFFSQRSDSGYFGRNTQDLMQQDPHLVRLRDLLLLTVAALLVALGLAVMALAWWGVRAGQAWAYGSLLAVGAAAAVYWAAIIAKYLQAGAPVGLGDVPPFMWVTTALWLGGVAAGAVAPFH